MQASYNWLKELSGVDASPDEVAERLTSAGLEVEGIERLGEGLDRVIVAEVRGIRPHPSADKLRLVTLFDGEAEQEVVCGAPNVPAPGGRVVFARLGATLPGGLTLEERSIRGVTSRGMICSEVELGIGEGGEGILVLDTSAVPGTPVADALHLRDAIFAIGLTPNRPDCLGHVGLARELALLFGRPFSLPPVPGDAPAFVAEGAIKVGFGSVTVNIDDPEGCPRYGAALVQGVTVGPSPFWLRYRLRSLGLRSISNLVDATNLVMLEEGHPIHGFDLARLRKRAVVVRRARKGEVMATLDGVERRFFPGDLLICDGKGPVAVAGVMGGAESELADTTRNVLIECAYFDPRSVRRTSRRLGLHTDASHRFERGVDPNAVPRVLARAAALLAELGGGTVAPTAIDRVAKPIAPKRIRLRSAKMRALLGLAIPAEVSRRVMVGIGAEVVAEDAEGLEVLAPTHRPDLGREVDLVEEVVRIHGYDQIPTTVPRVRPSPEGTPAPILFAARLRRAACASGLNEAICYSFVSPADLHAARASLDAVMLENPLSEERSVMRTSLLPGLAQAAAHARRRGAGGVALFELGRAFHSANTLEGLPIERPVFALLLTGALAGFREGERAYDFYDGKGHVEAIVAELAGRAPSFVLDEHLGLLGPGLHPRRRALVRLGDEWVGVLGELHPEVAEALELGERAVFAELDVEALERAVAALGEPRAPELPRFPATTRDIALLLDEGVSMGEARDVLLDAARPLGEAVTLFDLYRGEHVPEGKKSLAFRVVYRDPEATLTDKQVDKAHQKVADAARKRLSATIR
jgi:phenylalanyl-tRNA synthetase beta chain